MFKLALITTKKQGPQHLFQRSSSDLGIMSLEAYLTSRMDDIDVLLTEEIDDIVAFKPDLVGISITSENYCLAIKMTQEIRKRADCPVIAGGAHVTDCPESLTKDFELGVRGEGEETLLEVVKVFKQGPNHADNYKDIQGIVFHGSKGPVLNPMRPPIKDLSVLPLPNRRKWVDKIGLAFVMTVRGCPFHCWFCAARENYSGLRYFPVDHSIAEMKGIIANFHPKCIRIFDDVFNLSKDRVREMTSRMISEGLTKDVSYMCWIRAELLDQEYVDMLRAANFIYVSFGVESADDSLMKKMKGGRINRANVQDAIDRLYDAGIFVSCTFIFGIPGETAHELDETLEFIDKNSHKLLNIELNPLVPMPSTPLWKYAEDRGLVSKDMDWECLSDTGYLPHFNVDHYIYLNDAMPFEEFKVYAERFKALSNRININQANADFAEATFPISVYPARLKRLA